MEDLKSGLQKQIDVMNEAEAFYCHLYPNCLSCPLDKITIETGDNLDCLKSIHNQPIKQ